MPALNRAGRPGLIALAERTRSIARSSPQSSVGRESLLYEAVRAVAQAEAAVARFSSARDSDVSSALERLAIMHDSGDLSDGEFVEAKTRVISSGSGDRLS